MKLIKSFPIFVLHLTVYFLLGTLIHGCNYGQTNANNQVAGIDVSHYQGTINWKLVANSQVKFAIAKASGGTDYTDPMFKVNWQGIRENELIRGAYHFYYPNIDPVKQANFYLETVGKFLDKDLPPILDIELTEGQDSNAIIQGVLRWIKAVEKATGRRPIIYSDNAFAKEYLSSTELTKYPLWVADYNDEITSLPLPWIKTSWVIWQYSEQGQLKGVSNTVDLNKFAGNLRQLRHFVTHSHL